MSIMCLDVERGDCCFKFKAINLPNTPRQYLELIFLDIYQARCSKALNTSNGSRFFVYLIMVTGLKERCTSKGDSL